MAPRYVRLDLDELELYRAIAEEAAMSDHDLDVLEERLADPALDPGVRAALAIKIARAGRQRSIWALRNARSEFARAHLLEPLAVLDLALDLVLVPPSPRVELGDSGYQHRGEDADGPLFVEDPIAGYWHRQGRIGPPIRPDPRRRTYVAQGPGQVETAFGRAEDGDIVLITFQPARWSGRTEPPLRLTRAGMARDLGLTISMRWSEVTSVGLVLRGTKKQVAYEVLGEPRATLPEHPSIPNEDLARLIGMLLELARK
ncbi:MAG: hypothetical protein U1E65_12550 [Myxococcota bacterium]